MRQRLIRFAACGMRWTKQFNHWIDSTRWRRGIVILVIALAVRETNGIPVWKTAAALIFGPLLAVIIMGFICGVIEGALNVEVSDDHR